MQATHPNGDVYSFVFDRLPGNPTKEVVRQLNTQFMTYTDDMASFQIIDGRLHFSFEDRGHLPAYRVAFIHETLMHVLNDREHLYYMSGRRSFTRLASGVHRCGWIHPDKITA